MEKLWALGIFVLVYGIILAGERSPRKLDRPAAGLVGAVLVVLFGVLSRREALAAIDFGTLALLFGMMVIIHYATLSGLLDRVASRLVGGSRSAVHFLWVIAMSAGVLSALFVNDTICLLMTPLVLHAVRRKHLPAEPYLLALATSSNVGSLMTLTGNPQNMLIGQSSHWTWGTFSLRMVPIGLICLIVNGLVVSWIYRSQLKGLAISNSGESVDQDLALDRKLAAKTLVVLVGVLCAFVSGAPMDVAALAGAVAILVWANVDPQKTFAAVDWSLLLFFAGLFVVVGGITKTESGWINQLVPFIADQHGTLARLTLFSLGSVAGSNLFSNVPFVMLIRTVIPHLADAALFWLALAASSTLAGNLTLVGSVANLIVAQGAKDEYPLTFGMFFRVGALSTTLTVAASILLLWLYASLGWAR